LQSKPRCQWVQFPTPSKGTWKLEETLTVHLQIHPDSTRDNVICNFKSRFIDFPPDADTPWFMMTDIFIPPHTINFLTVFGKFDLANNGAVFGSVIAIILLSLIGGLWARSTDLRDRRKVNSSALGIFYFDTIIVCCDCNTIQGNDCGMPY